MVSRVRGIGGNVVVLRSIRRRRGETRLDMSARRELGRGN
jgi:hypothetical protein